MEKVWEDNNNQYGQRPDSVTVELQATTSTGNVGWKNAYDLLSNFHVELAQQGFTRDSTIVELNADNDWSYTWDSLPVSYAGDSSAGFVAQQISYRVIERSVNNGEVLGVREVRA